MTSMSGNSQGRSSPTGLTPKEREKYSLLVERIAAFSDKSAFAEVFSYYAPRVKSYLLRLGCTDSESEDIAQDVMVNVWRKSAQYDRRQASVSTWIFRIARNRRIDAARRDDKPPLDENEPALKSTELAEPETLVALSQMETVVRGALVDLPSDQADLIRAAYYEGLSQSEIAERFKLPLGTVKSRIRLAFGKLRSKLSGEEF